MELLVESPLTDLTDAQLVDLCVANYYTLGSTGEDAVNALAWDIAQGAFTTYHGLSDERMGLVLVLFARRMSLRWATTAIDYYKKEGK